MKGRGAVLAALIVIGLTVFAVLGLGNVQRASGHNQPPQLQAGQRRQARRLHDLRQRPLPTRQPERPVGSRADAAPAQFHPGQRDAQRQRPHGPDLAHRERDPDQPDRHVLGPARAGRLELLPLLQERRIRPDELVLVVQVLDRPDGRRRTRRPPTPTTTWSTATAAVRRTRRRRGFRTRSAGCDWGATALANIVLENTGTGPAGDMTKVFGQGSPEWNEALAANAAPAGTAARNIAQTDFVGLAIHCAKGSKSICNGNPNAKPDALPDEPGGYTGFQGLFGAKYVNPAICTVSTSNCTNATVNGQTGLKKLDGTLIADQFNQPGFPGFDGLFASTTLSYVAQMQEAGIPVTFGYISDAHDQHGAGGRDSRDPRAGRGRLRPAAAQLRHGVRPVLRPPEGRRDHEEEHALRLHRRGGRPLRGLAPVADRLRRRQHAVHLQPRGRGQRQPGRPDGDPAGDHDAVHRPFGHGADDLPQRQPGAGRRGHASVRPRGRRPARRPTPTPA